MEQEGRYDAETYDYPDNGEDYDYASEDYLDDYDDAMLDYDADYGDDLGYEGSEEFQTDVAELQDMLYEEIEGLSPEEAQEFYGEFLGALAGALPAIIGAAPSIIKGIGGLFGGGRRRPRRRARPRPRRRPQHRPQPSGAGIRSLSQKLDQLIALLGRRQ